MFLQKDNLNEAVEAVSKGFIIGIPTETVYGIGVDPYSEEAVKNLFNIKERDDNKPVSLLVPSYTSIHKLDIISEIPEVVDLYWPGPLTVVVETNENFVDGVGTKSPNTIGLRVPDNELTAELLNMTGPLAVTSANLTGQKVSANFGGLIECGDMYYDLAKLNHNLVVNHEIVNNDLFTVKKINGEVVADIHRRQSLIECQEVYHNWILENGYDLNKVKVLTSLIWLNMSALHHHPFDEFLYYYGKYTLLKTLGELENEYTPTYELQSSNRVAQVL